MWVVEVSEFEARLRRIVPDIVPGLGAVLLAWFLVFLLFCCKCMSVQVKGRFVGVSYPVGYWRPIEVVED
jgi:hypothetical protein